MTTEAPAATTLRPSRVRTTEEDWLDSLRGLAACSVVWFHLNEIHQFSHQPYRWLTKHGWLGVEVFFVISGCLIVASAARSRDWTTFLIRRWWRIYPPYLASVLVVIGAAGARHFLAGTNDFTPIARTPAAWAATLTLTTVPVTTVPAMNWVYWSLSYEAAFYLVVALAFIRKSWAPAILFAVTIAGILYHLGVLGVAPFFLNLWDLFALGAALAWTDRPRISLPLAALSILSLVCHASTAVMVVSLATAASIALSRLPAFSPVLREPLFRRIAIVSYSLYLLHVPIGCGILVHYLRPATATLHPIVHIATDALILAVCIGCSFLFWRWVEKPAHDYGRRITARAS